MCACVCARQSREFAVIQYPLCKTSNSGGVWCTESLSQFIKTSGIANVELKDEDVQQIIDSLIYDGKVDKVKDANLSLPVSIQTEINTSKQLVLRI